MIDVPSYIDADQSKLRLLVSKRVYDHYENLGLANDMIVFAPLNSYSNNIAENVLRLLNSKWYWDINKRYLDLLRGING